MKKAHLVYVSIATRVVVDENTTEEEIIQLANAQITNNIIVDGIFENVEEILEDDECPYNADFDEKSNAMLVYYKFECDDINRPPHVETDLTFELSEYDKVLKAMEELDSNGLKYTLVLERFDERTDLIVSRDYLKVN